ncbi:MAG: hypothetical protein U0793_33255 [Gemmataceae bacterium]
MSRSSNEGIRLLATFEDRAVPLAKLTSGDGGPKRSLFVVFRPGMQPRERYTIEDELKKALAQMGKITGSGTAVALSESDISIDVVDVQRGLQIVGEALTRLRVQ